MRNVYRVNPRKWRKWSIVAKGTFNRLYPEMRDNADLIRSPKDPPPASNKVSAVLAWNVAWLAADYVDETLDAIAKGKF